MSESGTEKFATDGMSRTDGRRSPWRPTWPIGDHDDFVSDLSDGGWARLKLARDGLGHGRWHWTIAGRGPRESGWAASREAGEAALSRHLGPHRSTSAG